MRPVHIDAVGIASTLLVRNFFVIRLKHRGVCRTEATVLQPDLKYKQNGPFPHYKPSFCGARALIALPMT